MSADPEIPFLRPPFANINDLWGRIAAETLHRVGVRRVVVAPGSRSTPLTCAFAAHPGLEAEVLLDERSASFYALGLSKASGCPTVLVCTSGTAASEFYSAVIEAREQRVPLLVMTADRPPEMRHCFSGQTIDQTKLYGTYPLFQAEMSVPENDPGLLRYLRQSLAHAVDRCAYPFPGPVHLNCPFRDPLAPIVEGLGIEPPAEVVRERFFAHLTAPAGIRRLQAAEDLSEGLLREIRGKRCLLLVGESQLFTGDSGYDALAALSADAGLPILAGGLSRVRSMASRFPNAVYCYDALCRSAKWQERLAPEVVIQVGRPPTAKLFRQWLSRVDPLYLVVDPFPENPDPAHGRSTFLRCDPESMLRWLAASMAPPRDASYLSGWLEAEEVARSHLNTALGGTDWLFEGKLAWSLARSLEPGVPVFWSNSMPIRDAEFFGLGDDSGREFHCNRGANGIDGVTSTAMGVASVAGKAVLVTGDLAFLHDSNALLHANRLKGHLTIILVNNSGGGIFEALPVHALNPPFEEFFATPQPTDLAALSAAHGLEHLRVESWAGFDAVVKELPRSGVRVVELRTDRKRDMARRRELLNAL